MTEEEQAEEAAPMETEGTSIDDTGLPQSQPQEGMELSPPSSEVPGESSSIVEPEVPAPSMESDADLSAPADGDGSEEDVMDVEEDVVDGKSGEDPSDEPAAAPGESG